MRITNSMMVNQFLSDSNDALNRVSKYQSQVDSTKKISSISDDPQATALALRARHKLSNISLYKSNIQAAKSYLTEAESSVSSLNEVVKSAYDDIMSANTGGKSKEDYRVLAEDIKNLQDEVLSIANTSIGTSYLFGGYNYTGKLSGTDKTPPFSLKNGDLYYNGINLSKISWKADFDKSINQMTEVMTTQENGSDLMSIASAYNQNFRSYSDTYAKGQASSMLDSIKTILSGAKDAMEEAEAYGIDSGRPEYTAFKDFYDKLTNVKTELETELAKDVPGNYILDTAVPSDHKLADGTIDYEYYQKQGLSVYTKDQLDNTKFNKQTVYNIINVDHTSDPTVKRPNSMFSLLTGSTSPSKMTAAMNTLSGIVTTPTDATNYTASIQQIDDLLTVKTDDSDLKSLVSAFSAGYAGYTQSEARAQTQKIVDYMKTLASDAKTAMTVAKDNYGIDPVPTAFSDFYNQLNSVTNELETELSQFVTGSYILDTDVPPEHISGGVVDTAYYDNLGIKVYTQAQLDTLSFNKQNVYDILNTVTGSRPVPVASLLTGTTIPAAKTALTTAVNAATPATNSNIPNEASKVTQFQIGTTQTVSVTMTGLDLMGTGDSNLFHLLDKCSKILSSDEVNPDDLSKMITSLQDSQNNVLTLQTKIGSTQNRMTLMSNRYETSELNYAEMKSNAEDADLAEAIMNLTTAQTVYNAALAGGSEILKTSLIDFLR